MARKPPSRDKELHINTSSESVFTALRLLSRTDQPAGVADLQAALHEPTSSVHRVLATLEEARYAGRYEGSARFVPGVMCFHLIRALVNRFPIRTAALPVLRHLVEETDGSATLNARVGWYSLRLAFAEGRVDYYQARRVGEVRLLHEDAAPLAMLAALDDVAVGAYRQFIARRIPQAAPAVLSPNLDQDLEEAHKAGAVFRPDPQLTDQIWAGFPIVRAPGQPVAAIGVTLRSPRTDAAKGLLAAKARRIVADFNNELLAHPERLQTPFAHLAPNDIVLPLHTEPGLRPP